jgi:YD repeat-containing protein
VNGETITYQYDALRRLVNASSTMGWSSGYSYDGFGNLTDMTGAGGAPALSTGPADWATNRITPGGVSYDGNGNINAMPNTTLGYDVANRLVSVSGSNGTGVYAYDPQNHRVYASVSGSDTIFLYPEFVSVSPNGRTLIRVIRHLPAFCAAYKFRCPRGCGGPGAYLYPGQQDLAASLRGRPAA